LAGLEEVPVLLRRSADRESLEIALIENLQREDLNPVDEARAYLRLSEEFGRTHAEISQEVGKDRTTVTNLLRILRLPHGVLNDVSRGTLSVGHARVLLGVEDPGRQADLARRMVAEGWNVRQAERFVSQINKPAKSRGNRPGALSRGGDVVRIEEALRYALGAEVHLDHGANGGRIEIRYESNEELERILEVFGIQIH
jgi:ParB family chromosome partitioning protein